MIRLRAIEESDLEMLHKWRNSDSVMPYVREYRYLSMADQKEWFGDYRSQRRRADFDQDLMIIERDHALAGVGGFVRIEWRNSKGELSFYPNPYLAETNQEDAILDCLKVLLGKGFQELNFHKVYWPIYSHDPRLPIYKKIFREEAVLKEEYFWNGQYQDRHYLSLTKKEFDNLAI